jgi:hypothetical protein
VETTERFLWDMRKTSQELVIEEHAGEIKQLAHQHGLLYSNEPYDMNPAGNIDLGSDRRHPDVRVLERQTRHPIQLHRGGQHRPHHGSQIVKAEAFTSEGSRSRETPANMKNQTDWAFAMGINGIVFHTYQHQPLGENGRPGITLGPHGIHWHRNQTFWGLLNPYHHTSPAVRTCCARARRCQTSSISLPEGAPAHLRGSGSMHLKGMPRMRDKKGYRL